jgi:transglutaminase-like putative cysteine protease
MSRFRVVHRTEYRYGAAVSDGFTQTHLLPRETPGQQVITSGIRIDPEPDEVDESIDVFGNRVVQFAVHRAHDELVVEATSEVVSHPQLYDGIHPTVGGVARHLRTATGDVAASVRPFNAASPMAPSLPELHELTDGRFDPARSVIDACIDLCHAIYAEFRFDSAFSDIATPLATVLAARRGVCQDFAHVAVASLRSVGLAARYVSGYIETVPPPGQPKLVGADASHAWCSCWVPGFGWLDFDPTNDQVPPLSHITVGWGRDYSDLSPVRGVVIGPGGGQELLVGVDVTRLAEPI